MDAIDHGDRFIKHFVTFVTMDYPVGVPENDIYPDVSRRLFNYQAYGCSFTGDDCISLSSRLYLKYENVPPDCDRAMEYQFPDLSSPLCKEIYEYVLMVLSDPAAIINHGSPEELAKQARTFGTNPWTGVSTLRLISEVNPDGTVVEHIQYSPSQFSLGMDDVLIVIQEIDVFDALSHCHELVCHRGAFTTYAEVKKKYYSVQHEDVVKFVSICLPCSGAKLQLTRPSVPSNQGSVERTIANLHRM